MRAGDVRCIGGAAACGQAGERAQHDHHRAAARPPGVRHPAAQRHPGAHPPAGGVDDSDVSSILSLVRSDRRL